MKPQGAPLIFIVVLLAGCASQQPPPESPTAAEIAGMAAELTAANVSPAAYAAIGLTLAQRSCAAWFSAQVMEAQNTKFGGQALTMLGGVAAAAGGPAGIGAAAGASALANILGASQAASAAGTNPAMVYGLIARIQQAWLAAMPSPLTVPDAYALVEAFAEQCNLPNIQAAVMQALTSVPVSAAPVTPAPVALLRSAEADVPAIAPPLSAHKRTPARPRATHYPQSTPSSALQQEWEQSARPFTGRMPQVVIGRAP